MTVAASRAASESRVTSASTPSSAFSRIVPPAPSIRALIHTTYASYLLACTPTVAPSTELAASMICFQVTGWLMSRPAFSASDLRYQSTWVLAHSGAAKILSSQRTVSAMPSRVSSVTVSPGSSASQPAFANSGTKTGSRFIRSVWSSSAARRRASCTRWSVALVGSSRVWMSYSSVLHCSAKATKVVLAVGVEVPGQGRLALGAAGGQQADRERERRRGRPGRAATCGVRRARRRPRVGGAGLSCGMGPPEDANGIPGLAREPRATTTPSWGRPGGEVGSGAVGGAPDRGREGLVQRRGQVVAHPVDQQQLGAAQRRGRSRGRPRGGPSCRPGRARPGPACASARSRGSRSGWVRMAIIWRSVPAALTPWSKVSSARLAVLLGALRVAGRADQAPQPVRSA